MNMTENEKACMVALPFVAYLKEIVGMDPRDVHGTGRRETVLRAQHVIGYREMIGELADAFET